MKRGMVKGLAVALALAMVSFAASAWAGEGWGSRKEGKGGNGHFEKMANELALTAEQKDALAKHREATEPKMKEIREKTRVARESLREELDKAKPDKSKIASIIAQLKELAGEKVEMMVDRMLTMKEVLTPEQSARMRDIMEKKRAESRERRGEHGERGHEGPPHEDM
jgi:Spy/CpxP family protein refolding chaperone